MDASVFIVDDEDSLRAGYTILLERAGYRVRAFACAEDLLIALGAGARPDLILTDNGMPGMSGTALVHHLRVSGFTKPIVMISGSHGIMEDKTLMREVTGFLPKPAPIADIVAAVARALGS